MRVYIRQRWRDIRSQIRIAWLRLVGFLIGSDRLELRFLRYQAKRNRALLLDRLKSVHRDGYNPAGVRDIHDEASYEASMFQEQIDSIETRRLLIKAARFGVLVETKPEDWDEGSHFGKRSLTPVKSAEVRKAIRTEQAERRAVWDAWAIIGSAVTIVTGLVGACIGLVSMLRK